MKHLKQWVCIFWTSRKKRALTLASYSVGRSRSGLAAEPVVQSQRSRAIRHCSEFPSNQVSFNGLKVDICLCYLVPSLFCLTCGFVELLKHLLLWVLTAPLLLKKQLAMFSLEKKEWTQRCLHEACSQGHTLRKSTANADTELRNLLNDAVAMTDF